MEKRVLGRTGLEVSLLGFGGFHLLEIPADEALRLLNYYLDNGGNYIETAADYGNGESEKKIGPIIASRRDEIVLASKTSARDREGVLKDLDRTLNNLQTNQLDLYIMHHVENIDELDKIMAPGGAMEGVREAQDGGKVKYVGISMHGQPDVLIEALKKDHFDAVMATFNYFDRFNFPKLESELLPLAREKDVGIILMKALADGLLWRSAKTAFQYAFSLPVSIVVTGMNSMEMLKTDLEYADNYKKMTEEEKGKLFREAPELGNYICRQCKSCSVTEQGEALKEVFKLEGYYDRQMRDGNPRNPADFALRDRLRFWFGNDKLARNLYDILEVKAIDLLADKINFKPCKYDLPIEKKLQICHYKLGDEKYLF